MNIQAINRCNRFRGKVVAISEGPALCEADLQMPAGLVTSVITTSSIRSLGLKPGSEVIALDKSTEGSIARR